MTEPVPCPTDDQLSRLAAGTMTGPALEALEKHLDLCRACRQLFAVVTDGSAPTAQVERSVLRPGDRLGRYEIEQLIGAGGMGILYVARDLQLGRRVALKLMRPSIAAGEGARVRLLREAQAMAQLSHPNVVSVFELGDVDGRVFVAMELLEGGTLRDWMKKPHTWKDTVAMFCAAGEGLAAAHANGVVHRDFKPENVMVGKDERPRVGDFGLARPELIAHEEAPINPSLPLKVTRTGSMLGTPAYMAPEQLSGKPADARSDQYGFCVSLYEALAGQRPFPADTLEELRARVSGGMPPPPRDGLIPAHVWAAIARGLNPNPAERFPDMNALMTVLRFDAPPPRRARRMRFALAAGALSALLVVAVTALRSVAPAEQPVATAAPAPAAQAREATGIPEKLVLNVGAERVLDVTGIERVAVGADDIADVKSIQGLSGIYQIVVFGVGEGETLLLVWTKSGQRHDIKLQVTRASKAEGELPEKLVLSVGAQKVLDVPGLERLAVGDADIADVKTIEGLSGINEAVVLGVSAGQTTLLLWTTGGQRHEMRLQVTAPSKAGTTDGDLALPKKLVLSVGAQKVLDVPGLERVALGDPSIADVKPIEGSSGINELMVLGVSEGQTTLLLWTKSGQRYETTLQVTAPSKGETDLALPEKLVLSVGAQKVLDVPGLERVAVGDPTIADVKPIGGGTGINKLMVLGASEGKTTLLLWTKGDHRHEMTLHVTGAAADASKTEAGISLQVGGSRVLTVPGLKRVAIGDSEIADVSVNKGKVVVKALKTGGTTLMVWSGKDKRTTYAVAVEPEQAPRMPLKLSPGADHVVTIDGLQALNADPAIATVKTEGDRAVIHAVARGTTTLRGTTRSGDNVALELTVE